MSKSLLDLGVKLPVKHVAVFISSIIGVNVEDTQHLRPGPLHHGSDTAMGSRLNTLRGNGVFGDKDGQAPATRKMVGVLLPCRCPDAIPTRCKAGLSLGIDLLLVKLVFLDKKRSSLLGAQPSDSVSGTTRVGC